MEPKHWFERRQKLLTQVLIHLNVDTNTDMSTTCKQHGEITRNRLQLGKSFPSYFASLGLFVLSERTPFPRVLPRLITH